MDMVVNSFKNWILFSTNPRLKAALVLILKGVVSIGSLFFVIRSVDWESLIKVLTHVQMFWIVLALLIFWGAQVVSALRCVYIARVLGGSIPLATSLRAHFIGLWFNQMLPTSLGGDVIKVAILKKSLGFSIALRSAILDRLSGFIFLLLAIAFMLPLYADIFSQKSQFTYMLAALSLGGIATIILCAWGTHITRKYRSLHPIILKFIQIFSDIWSFRRGQLMWNQFWTSAIVHFNGIAAYGLLGKALAINVDLITLVLLVPLVFLVALLPVSFAGWGVREVGAVWLFSIVGVAKEDALAISIAFGLLLLVAGLPGLFLLYSGEKHEAK